MYNKWGKFEYGVMMLNIPVHQLLRKMEKELNEAKNSAETSRMRERVHAIQMLCELILDEPEKELKPPVSMANTYAGQNGQQLKPLPVQQSKRLEMDDDANGESLFDF
jgi:hypothetical protein